jgi:diaminopimelate epimerase
LDVHFYKYHGTGNDFILIDNRNLTFPAEQHLIEKLCDRRFGIGADGLILLQNHDELDFDMRYFNSDGREASMCGNGGRCVVAFAVKLGLISKEANFNAFDGAHKAVYKNETVELHMSDVRNIKHLQDLYILDTGSPQAIKFVTDLNAIDVVQTGREIRYNKSISQNGVNVNFVKVNSVNSIDVRTYERGVENETWSCGTGSVAAAIVNYLHNKIESNKFAIEVNVKGGNLTISFETTDKATFTNIKLIGSATLVYTGKISVPE